MSLIECKAAMDYTMKKRVPTVPRLRAAESCRCQAPCCAAETGARLWDSFVRFAVIAPKWRQAGHARARPGVPTSTWMRRVRDISAAFAAMPRA